MSKIHPKLRPVALQIATPTCNFPEQIKPERALSERDNGGNRLGERYENEQRERVQGAWVLKSIPV